MKNKTSLVLIALNITVLAFASWVMLRKTDRIAYVRTVDLFNEFELKKSLSSEFQQIENRRSHVLDSLKVNITALETQLRAADIRSESTMAEYKQKFDHFNQLSQQFSTETKQVEERYNEQVWTQLNQYVNDYGEKNGYVAILGAAGNGNVMYANSNMDITKELIEYSNNKFNGLSGD